MVNILDWLFNPSGLTPHGFCLNWAPGLVAVHAISDGLIGVAYFSIPLAIASFTGQRRDLKYSWVAYLFVAFILACGSTHIFSILTLWVPVYGIEGVIKAITAALSVATAVLLWPLIPKLVALPSVATLERLNVELAARNEEQTRMASQLRENEAQLQAVNTELERRVARRTAELEAVNAQLHSALAERTTALSQRDLLLREVYHRVKNNLQLIDSMLVLQARDLADAAGKAALNGIRSRVYALGLVHQQLMDSTSLEVFDIAPFLSELVKNIVAGGSAGEIALKVRTEPLNIGLDRGIPLGLLVTELVTNSLKHAFPDGGGEIEVGLERLEDGSMLLVVADNGIGYRPAEPGAPDRPRSLGTRIIAGLVAQLGGEMSVKTTSGTRTEVKLKALTS